MVIIDVVITAVESAFLYFNMYSVVLCCIALYSAVTRPQRWSFKRWTCVFFIMVIGDM